MFKLLKISLVWGGILLSFSSYGQWRPDLPLGVLPMQFNPSFAGEAGAPRFNSAISYALIGMDGYGSETVRTYASYDQFLPALRSGIGFTVGHMNYNFTGLTLPGRSQDKSNASGYDLSLAIAPKFSLKGKYTFSPSVDFSYRSSEGGRTRESLYDGRYELLQSRLGLLLNTSKYYIGYSATILNRDYLNGQKPDSIQTGFTSSIQAGYTFQKTPESKFSFTPQLSFSFKEKGSFLGISPHINLTARYKSVIGGVSNTGIHLGYQSSKLRLMLSQSLRTFTNSSYGVLNGNISFRYIFTKKDKGGPASW